MKKNYWIILFLVLLLGDLLGVLFKNEQLQYACKPLLIPVLAGHFIISTKNYSSGLKRWLLFALLFSWLGDILLMITVNPSLFFILGLSSFLLAHLFYILFYHTIRLEEQIPGKPVLLLPVAVYFFAMMVLLNPYLGSMKLPVRIYAVVISFMFMLSL
ncbi:MAG: lysoplasmalogenase, partial [Bacteroidetes bacterium]|nr:lysoplasmalogenase [Bacteroidota bacterium]